MKSRFHLRALAVSSRRHKFGATIAACLAGSLWLGANASAQQASTGAQFQAASELIVRFEFDDAYDSFAELRDALGPSHARYREACFGLAVAAQHRIPPEMDYINEAAALYEEIIALNATDALAARSMINLGRILELRDDLNDPIRPDDAIQYYDQVIAQFPNEDVAHEAAFRKAGALIQQFNDPPDIERGVKELEQWLATYPDNPFAGGMHVYLYDYYRPLDQPEPALRHLIEGDRAGFPVSRVGEMYWQGGRLAETLPDRLDDAVYFYTKVITDAVSSGRAYEAQSALERLKREHPDAQIEVPKIVFGGASPTQPPAPTPAPTSPPPAPAPPTSTQPSP